MDWIKCSDRLPDEGKYVLAVHNRGTWFDSSDQKHVNFVIVKLVKGITEKERFNMIDCDRKKTYKFGDEFGNNLVPYGWDQFGPDCFFGQTITHWIPLPEPPGN